MTWEWFQRLESLPPHGDLQRGFAAEVADPVWMLARQWELGEHLGEDAGAPTVVEVAVRRDVMGEIAGQDPTVVPAEALLEGATEDWWTVGRRVRVGRSIAGRLTPQQRIDYAFALLPEPYGDAFAGEVDGYRAWRDHLVPVDDPAVAGLVARPDFWRSATLRYEADIPVGGVELQVRGHGGGEVDWFTADAADAAGGAGAAPPLGVVGDPRQVIPLRLQYPGAPLPRWWQIEDHAVDIGGFPPDRSHLATALLIELIAGHSSDWFLFPVPAADEKLPGVGALITLEQTRVRDTFDDWWDLDVPPGTGEPVVPDGPAGPWSLFRTTGLDRASLVLWPTAATPITGPVLDDIVLAVDEDANLLWAVELRAGGVDLATDAEDAAAIADGLRTGSRDFTWLPATTLPSHWFPYRIETVDGPPRRAFVQGLVADLQTGTPQPGRPPSSELIGGGEPGHMLETSAVPNAGLRLERGYVLARGTDGRPVLWRQRRRVPLLAGPQSHLRFDVLREAPLPP